MALDGLPFTKLGKKLFLYHTTVSLLKLIPLPSMSF